MPPRPTSPSSQQRWFQERLSDYTWEQDGLDHIKRLMPSAEPFRAWATFSFTAASGRIHECDLFIAVPGGLYLLELKAHPGQVENHGDTWTFHQRGNPRPRTLLNPLHFTDLKSKELKSRLEWAALKKGIKKSQIPRIEPAVFLTDRGLRCKLDEVQQERVYGRDEAAVGLPWVWRDLLSKPPYREQQRVTPAFSRLLPELMQMIGIRASTAHLRFGDDWTLAQSLLDAGPTWEDRLAERRDIVNESGRVRIYLTAQQAGEEKRKSVERAARREYQVLQGIMHRGIAQAVQIREHQGRPAILFRHEASDVRLDSYLAVHAKDLTRETRLDLVRQLAEAVQYAHSRSLYHRALSARSVYVSAKDDGSSPVLRVIDWQAAARDFDPTVSSTLGITSLGSDVVAEAADLYLAPEFESPYPDPVDLDVFGLGSVAYLILTGEPPAATRSSLIDRLAAEGGLHPYGVDDTITDALDGLIFDATRSDVGERLDSAEAFMAALDATEGETADPEPSLGADPLTATKGQMLDEDWEVVRVLGTGATARALLVERLVDNGGDELELQLRVLKVALDEDKATSLEAEARALDVVGGGTVVQKYRGPLQLGGRTVLELQYAGGDDKSGGTLGALLRAEGRLPYHQLERFGGDLFTALDQLAARGVRHRDIKPDNFAVFKRADRSKQLMMLDFSLVATPERDVTAGTRGYLDPFLGTARRPVFDDHAERYAAAVTLYEMAANAKPVWGDGATDPRTTTDETPTISGELFEPALRDELVAFFRRALHRDADRRFDSVGQMQHAWREVFVVSDAAEPASTPSTVDLDPRSLGEQRDAAALATTRDTPLDAAGLSPRAVSVAQSFGATTVGELLDVPLYQIARARGAGAVIRKELNRRHKQWAAQLAAARPVVRGDAPFTVDELVRLLLADTAKRKSKKGDVARFTLSVPDSEVAPWTPQAELARRLGITQASVSRNQQALFAEWAGNQVLDAVRDELVEFVASAGRVATIGELAGALRARRGSTDEDPVQAMAFAVAAVRAAVEAEIWAGLHTDDEELRDQGPRLAVLRRDDAVLVALESLPGTDAPSPADLADFAQELGRRADALAVAEPMPGRGTVIKELRAVDAPDGLPPLADTRLVALAAAVSRGALVSPRLEIYPRGLDLVTALRASQAGAGVRRSVGISVDDVLGRVRARFPEVALPEGITHVQLQDALQEAGFTLDYDLEKRRFLPPESPVARSLTASSTTLGRVYTRGSDPHDVMRARLTSAIDQGGFLALTMRGRHLPGAAEAIAGAYAVRPVDLDAVFVEELRGLVAERGQDWRKVLTTDARFTESGRLSPGLMSYARVTWDRVRDRLTEAAAGGAVLFLHNAGLLGRYAAAGGHDLLVALQQAARHPAAAPYGLWLLCPGDSPSGTPTLDGHTVERIGRSEQLVLDGGFFDSLRHGSGSAA